MSRQEPSRRVLRVRSVFGEYLKDLSEIYSPDKIDLSIFVFSAYLGCNKIGGIRVIFLFEISKVCAQKFQKKNPTSPLDWIFA